MKKALITLLALSGMAMAEFNESAITGYAGAFTQGSGAANVLTLSSGTANIWFGENGKTLTSYCVQFTINSDTKTGPGETMFRTTTAGTGVGLQAWGPATNTYRGSAFYANGALRQNETKAWDSDTQSNLNLDFGATSHAAADQTPVTIRMAYDAANKMAYMYNVTSSTGVRIDLSSSTYDAAYTDLVSGVAGTMNTVGAFAFWGGERVFTDVLVYDLTNVVTSGTAGTADMMAFVIAPVPEPATATLSLLALAGLAARRRRH